VSVLSWYDNEWGFSNRMADTAVAMGEADLWISNFNPTHVEIRRARKSEWRRYAIVDGALIDDPRSRHD
jgi:hypothetical protein